MKKFFAQAYIWLLLVMLYAPIIFIGIFSFSEFYFGVSDMQEAACVVRTSAYMSVWIVHKDIWI